MAARPLRRRRTLLLCTDGGLHSDFAFRYYCTHVHRGGDFLVMLFCPDMDLTPTEKITDKDGAKKLGQLVIDEDKREMKDAEMLKQKLKDNVIDGKVIVASAAIPPKQSIIEMSAQENADMIILGSRRLGQELREGSTKQYVVRTANVSVLICKHGKYETKSKAREGVKRLVVAGSDLGMHASEGLKSYRKHIYREGDYMILAYVPKERPALKAQERTPKAITSSTGRQRLQEDQQKLYRDNASLLLEFIKNDLKMPGEVFTGEPNSNPGDVLLEVAEREGAHLIIVGARGLSEQAYEASYRTSDKVANDSQVTVFVNKY